MFCTKCGVELAENDKFCPKCGVAIGRENQEEKTVNLNGINMTADDMVQYCFDNNMMNIKNLYKSDRAIYRKLFDTIIDEIQSDEKPLLCFWGQHDYKALLLQCGFHAYILTNKRLITSGWANSKADLFNPINTYMNYAKVFMKNSKWCKSSLYLRDLIDVKVDMVSGKDVITFHTTKKDFNVMFWKSNVTHQLCDRINEILKQLKEEQLVGK